MSRLTNEHWQEARAATAFWLKSLEPCDCPPETYPTGDTRTLHEPYCSSVLLSVASAFQAAEADAQQLREALEAEKWRQRQIADDETDTVRANLAIGKVFGLAFALDALAGSAAPEAKP